MAKLDFDTDYLERLAELLQRSGLTEIEITHGETKIRVARQLQTTIEVPSYAHYGSPPPTSEHAATGSGGIQRGPGDPGGSQGVETAHPGAVPSPMVGTVYTAADPDSPPLVTIGAMVEEGQTLLIIEAMKVMNMIRAPRSGRVTQLFVQNAQPVEYGEPLLVIE